MEASKMTGKEIISMIFELNAEAKAQGGKLVELVLPQELWETLCEFEGIDFTVPELFVDNVRVHTGEYD